MPKAEQKWRREQQHDPLVPGQDWQIFCNDQRIATDLTEEQSRLILDEYNERVPAPEDQRDPVRGNNHSLHQRHAPGRVPVDPVLNEVERV
jgi:hypothetical protein